MNADHARMPRYRGFIALALLGVLVLVGCSSPAPPPDSSQSGTFEGDSTDEGAEAPDASTSDWPTDYIYRTYDDEATQFLSELCAGFGIDDELRQIFGDPVFVPDGDQEGIMGGRATCRYHSDESNARMFLDAIWASEEPAEATFDRLRGFCEFGGACVEIPGLGDGAVYDDLYYGDYTSTVRLYAIQGEVVIKIIMTSEGAPEFTQRARDGLLQQIAAKVLPLSIEHFL